MAKTMSIIRYKYKADRDFESVQFEGMNCSLGELKRLIIEKSSRSGAHHPRDDYDLLISNATTHEEYKDNFEMIPRNTSVVVARRIRGALESLTPTSNQKPIVSSDDIVNEYLRPAILKPTQNQSSSVNSTDSTTASLSSSGGKHSTKTDSTVSIGSGSTTKSLSNSSNNITHQESYQVSHHGNYFHGNRSHNRGSTHSRNESIPKSTTGIPRDGLIKIPVHIPGAYRDRTGASVVPRQMAELIIQRSEKKADALVQRACRTQEKEVSVPASSMLPTKSNDEKSLSDDLLCPLCKSIYVDAVITPCCHHSFCDECIRDALVESEDHECPHCHRQQVAINQINPNLFLRNHVNMWHEERQQKSSHLYMALSQTTSITNDLSSKASEQDLDLTSKQAFKLINRQNSDDVDECETAIPSTTSQQTIIPVKTAPIIIKMQPIGRSSSLQPILSTKPAEMTFEDGKASDKDQIITGQKDVNSESSTTNNNTVEENNLNTKDDTNVSEDEKLDRQTPQLQVAPTSATFSSPSATSTTTTSVVPHFYSATTHIAPHHQQFHHGIAYAQQIPPTSSSSGLYPIQHSYYPSTMNVSYPGVHHTVGAPPMIPAGIPIGPSGGIHPYHMRPTLSTGLPSHVPQNPVNTYHLTPYETMNASALHYPNPAFPTTSTPSIIPHHYQIGTQPVPALPTLTLSKDEFYIKQRGLQRIRRSNSRHRTRSRSSSYSHDSRSDSHSSSSSRNNDRRHRRLSTSRNYRRESIRDRHHSRTKSPNRDNRRHKHQSIHSNSKQRQSPGGHRSTSYGNRRQSFVSNEKQLSKHQRSSSRPYQSTQNSEKCRPPRPPPTIQQSTQRTIVYTNESSKPRKRSEQVNHRTKSSSRHDRQLNDDRIAPSSKYEEQSQSKSMSSTSPMTVPTNQKRSTLLSIIKPVIEDDISVPSISSTLGNVQLSQNNSMNRSNDVTMENNRNSDKKRKKHYHHQHKKHQRLCSISPNSKSKIQHHSEDDDMQTTINNEMVNSIEIIETQ